MSDPNVLKHDELVQSCIAAVTRKITTTLESIGQPDADISLVRSTVRSYSVPACIKIVLKPNTRSSVTPGARVPTGAREVGSEQEAQSLIHDHLLASPDDYRAARHYIRDTFAGDGLAIGARRTPLPEPCSQFVVAYTAHCQGCGGQTRVHCSQCGGQGLVRCSACQGLGYLTTTHTEPGQVMGSATAHIGASELGTRSAAKAPDETVTKRHECPSCCGSCQVRCLGCGGSGAVECEHCRGTGCVTACHSLTYEITTTIEWASAETHGKLQEWLENQDLDELVRSHAETVLHTEQQSSESHSLMRYKVTVPFGTTAFQFARDPEDNVLLVAGKAGDIVQGAGFVEATVPSFSKPHGEGAAISCAEALAMLADAVQNPVVRIVSTQALARADTDHDEVAKEVRRTLPAGLTDERICEIADAARCYAHLAFDRRRVFVRVARYALLSLVMFGAYFVLPVRTWIDVYTHAIVAHLVDMGVIAAGLIGISIGAFRVTQSEVCKTFSPLLGSWVGQLRHLQILSRRFAPTGKMLTIACGEVFLLFLLTAVLAAWMGRSAPLWAAWMCGR